MGSHILRASFLFYAFWLRQKGKARCPGKQRARGTRVQPWPSVSPHGGTQESYPENLRCVHYSTFMQIWEVGINIYKNQFKNRLLFSVFCCIWILCGFVKAGASGESGACCLFSVPSMTTGRRTNSRIIFYFMYCRNSATREEPYAAVLFCDFIIMQEQRIAKAPLLRYKEGQECREGRKSLFRREWPESKNPSLTQNRARRLILR